MTPEQKRNGMTWWYYQGPCYKWPLSKWRDWFFVYVPHKLKWAFVDLRIKLKKLFVRGEK